ncbi:MAG: myo-inositol-1-phosphate synthase, partial [Planctomycetes bacterium]|nr:myo-inositol-1-phosphate synthase [Planctomycetota bacterium]
MAKKKVGLWLIGACGGVGTTAALGLAAIRNKLSDTTSLVTELPLFESLKLDALDSFVVGGHEIRKGSFVDTARELHLKARIF